MKIALIGAGSYVFAPVALRDVIEKHRLDGCELTLVDLNLEAAGLMAGLARRMADDLGVRLSIAETDDRGEALAGADAVVLSASVQGMKRWRTDYEILRRHGSADQARECGGVEGLVNAFRSISLALDVAQEMERSCPGAALYDVTNPMPRVLTAVNRYTRVRCYGFCNIALGGPDGYEWLARVLGRRHDELDVVTAGLNHFAWLLEVRDRKTGADLTELAVREATRPERGREAQLLADWHDRYGLLAMGHVDHHAEYLPYDARVRYATEPPYHGTEDERLRRANELASIAEGKTPWRAVLAHGGSWEHPIDLAVALVSGGRARFEALNLPNQGYVRGIPDGRIVEVPVDVSDGRIEVRSVGSFPERLLELMRRVSDVHELAAEAGANGDLELARRAIDLDPAVTDKAAGLSALDEMLDAHADVLPRFAQHCGN